MSHAYNFVSFLVPFDVFILLVLFHSNISLQIFAVLLHNSDLSILFRSSWISSSLFISISLWILLFSPSSSPFHIVFHIASSAMNSIASFNYFHRVFVYDSSNFCPQTLFLPPAVNHFNYFFHILRRSLLIIYVILCQIFITKIDLVEIFFRYL